MTELKCDPDCEERTNCTQAGAVGHFQCGVCAEHGTPRHHCGCLHMSAIAAPSDEQQPTKTGEATT